MIINLRDYYSFYNQDMMVDVDERIVKQLRAWQRSEASRRRKLMRYQAYYMLDYDACEFICTSDSTEEVCEKRLSQQEVINAVASLPDKQAKRIHAFYFLSMCISDIARMERVSETAIRSSIERGMHTLRVFFLQNQ